MATTLVLWEAGDELADGPPHGGGMDINCGVILEGTLGTLGHAEQISEDWVGVELHAAADQGLASLAPGR
jgi:hypothetical protein